MGLRLVTWIHVLSYSLGSTTRLVTCSLSVFRGVATMRSGFLCLVLSYRLDANNWERLP
jgi:hypothetical protein